MKLIVLNLPRDLSEEALVELFTAHGTVQTCDLVIDKNTNISKGFGFVEMATEDEATVAINALHQSKLNKNKIRVKLANKTE